MLASVIEIVPPVVDKLAVCNPLNGLETDEYEKVPPIFPSSPTALPVPELDVTSKP